MVARIGGIAAPLLAGLHGTAPLIIMGGSSLLGGILAIFLPETLGAKLPETVAQVNKSSCSGFGLLKIFQCLENHHSSITYVLIFFLRLKICTKIVNHGTNGYPNHKLKICLVHQWYSQVKCEVFKS